MEIKKHPTFKKEYENNNANVWTLFWAIVAIAGFFYPFNNSNYGYILSILGVTFSLVMQFKKSKNLTSACCPSCNSIINTNWRDTNSRKNHMIKCVRCNIVWDLGIKKQIIIKIYSTMITRELTRTKTYASLGRGKPRPFGGRYVMFTYD